jgi:hypothetical protein
VAVVVVFHPGPAAMVVLWEGWEEWKGLESTAAVVWDMDISITGLLEIGLI